MEKKDTFCQQVNQLMCWIWIPKQFHVEEGEALESGVLFYSSLTLVCLLFTWDFSKEICSHLYSKAVVAGVSGDSGPRSW